MRKHTRASVDTAFLKQHGGMAFPLGLSIFISGLGDIIGGAIVRANFDNASFAIYRYGARELPFALLLANAFSTAAISHVAADLKTSLVYIRQRSAQMMHWLFPITIALLLGSKWFYPFVFRHDFAASAPIFNIYLLLIVSRLVFPQTILNGLQQTRPILIAACLEIALNVSLSLFFIKIWGITGVAYAAVIAYFMDKAILATYNYRRNGIGLTAYTDVKVWLGYTLLLMGSYVLSLYL
jgi:O-antigen/teichoic acid export membrane protein